MLRIGLTGGIGSGKSTVSDLFASLGVPIIDADVVAREVVAPGQSALREICLQFGDHLLDEHGALRRRLLRDIIFKNSADRLQLETILHPRIRQKMQERLTVLAHKHPYCILSIPLLLESGWIEMLDRVLVVDIEPSLQLQRTCQRDKLTEKSAQAIIDSQSSRQERLLAADDVIDNNGDPSDLLAQVQRLHHNYLKDAHK